MTNLLNNIILLEGEATIEGQLIARKEALKNCQSTIAKREINEGTLKGWIESHIETIKELNKLSK